MSQAREELMRSPGRARKQPRGCKKEPPRETTKKSSWLSWACLGHIRMSSRPSWLVLGILSRLGLVWGELISGLSWAVSSPSWAAWDMSWAVLGLFGSDVCQFGLVLSCLGFVWASWTCIGPT